MVDGDRVDLLLHVVQGVQEADVAVSAQAKGEGDPLAEEPVHDDLRACLGEHRDHVPTSRAVPPPRAAPLRGRALKFSFDGAAIPPPPGRLRAGPAAVLRSSLDFG